MERDRVVWMLERSIRGCLVAYIFIVTIPHTAALQSILFSAALLGLLIKWSLTRRIPFTRTPLDIPILLLTMVIIYKSVASVDPEYSRSVLFKEHFPQIFIFYLIASVMNTPRYVQRIILCLLISVAIVAGIGLYGYYQGSMIKAERATSYFGNFGRAAFYTSMIIPMALAQSLCNKHGWRLWVYSGVTILCLLFMITTLSRGAWISTLFAIILLSIIKSRKLLIVVFLIILAMPWVLPHEYIERGLSLTQVDEITGNEQFGDRFWLWRSAIEMIRDNPLDGAGYGNRVFSKMYPYYIDSRSSGLIFENAHNLYLQMAIEIGLPGLGLFLFIITSVLIRVARKIKSHLDTAIEKQILGIAGSLAVFVIFSMSTFRYENEIGLLFWILVASAVNMTRPESVAIETPAATPP